MIFPRLCWYGKQKHQKDIQDLEANLFMLMGNDLKKKCQSLKPQGERFYVIAKGSIEAEYLAVFDEFLQYASWELAMRNSDQSFVRHTSNRNCNKNCCLGN